MVKNRIQLRNVSNVAASKTVTIDLPIGPRYHWIGIEHGYASGTNTIPAAASNITEIRVLVNGRIQRRMTGTQLRDANVLQGAAFDCTGVPNTAPGVVFPIFFAEPWRSNNADQDALAWPTNLWSSFQVQIDLSTAGTPTILAYAVVDTMTVTKEPGIVKWILGSFNAGGTSFDVATLDKRDWLQQISFYPDSGGTNPCTKLTFRLNGNILHELSSAANIALITQFTMNPAPGATIRTANIYDLVLDHDGLLGSAVQLDGAKDVTFTLEAGGAMSGTVTAIIQRLGLAQ